MRFSTEELNAACTVASTSSRLPDRKNKAEYLRRLFQEGHTLEECVTIAWQLPGDSEMARLKKIHDSETMKDGKTFHRSSAIASEFERANMRRRHLIREATLMLGLERK